MPFKILAIVLILLVLGACSSFSPYKMEIRQGNYITQDMRKKLKVGMSRQQVMSLMGTPLVSDVFHVSRWDYVYRYTEKGEQVEQNRVSLFFEGDFVKRIEDGPTESVQAASK